MFRLSYVQDRAKISNIGHVVVRGHELQLTGFFGYVYPFAGKKLKDDSNCFAVGKDSLVLMSLLHIVNIVLFLFWFSVKLVFP